jgi:hypothetical protein
MTTTVRNMGSADREVPLRGTAWFVDTVHTRTAGASLNLPLARFDSMKFSL